MRRAPRRAVERRTVPESSLLPLLDGADITLPVEPVRDDAGAAFNATASEGGSVLARSARGEGAADAD